MSCTPVKKGEGEKFIADLNCSKKILKKYKEVAGSAIFVASSSRDGCGLENVRDDNNETYWQSSGQLPHNLDIIFGKPTRVSKIFILICTKMDESYTPTEIVVQAGMDFNALRCFNVKFDQIHKSWQEIDIVPYGKKESVEVMMIRLVILSNHLYGIDTRIRQIVVCGPEEVKERNSFEENASLASCSLANIDSIR